MPNRPTSPKIRPGEMIAPRQLVTIHGKTVSLPDDQQLIHLHFRRFAGCPVCNLHLHSVIQRHADIQAAGIREVVFFHSNADELLRHAADLPFAVIADPDKRLYAEFGVEASPRALLDWQVWLPIIRGVARTLVRVIRKQARTPDANPHGGRLGLPADFLSNNEGRVLACKYGAHAYDQWPVAELLSLAGQHAPRQAQQSLVAQSHSA
jgi:peroxiredoxin